MKTKDTFSLLPNYKFFCPQPIRYDYHLYFRARLGNGVVSEWQEIVIGRRSPKWSFAWNPSRRERKIFYRLVKTIKQKYKGKTRTKIGNHYRQILNLTAHFHPDEIVKATQFKISSRQDLNQKDNEKVLFTSNFHEYAPA